MHYLDLICSARSWSFPPTLQLKQISAAESLPCPMCTHLTSCLRWRRGQSHHVPNVSKSHHSECSALFLSFILIRQSRAKCRRCPWHTGKVEKPENLSKAKCNLEKLGLHQQVKLDLGFCHPCAEMCGRYF